MPVSFFPSAKFGCASFAFILKYSLVLFIFDAGILYTDAAVAKNSIPFDPFRLECPFFHSIIKLDLQRVESTEAVRTDTMLTSFCENIKKLYPSPRDPTLTTADENCRWTPNFQIPGELFDITHTCSGREFLSGISRQSPGEYGFLCCKLKDRKKGDCAIQQFALPTTNSPSVQLDRGGKRVLTAIGQEKNFLVAQFCELEIMNRREVDEEFILAAKVRLLNQRADDKARKVTNEKDENEDAEPGIDEPLTRKPSLGQSSPGVRPPAQPPRSRAGPPGRLPTTTIPEEFEEAEETSAESKEEGDGSVARLASGENNFAAPAFTPPQSRSSAKRRGALRTSSKERQPSKTASRESPAKTTEGDSEATSEGSSSPEGVESSTATKSETGGDAEGVETVETEVPRRPTAEEPVESAEGKTRRTSPKEQSATAEESDSTPAGEPSTSAEATKPSNESKDDGPRSPDEEGLPTKESRDETQAPNTDGLSAKEQAKAVRNIELLNGATDNVQAPEAETQPRRPRPKAGSTSPSDALPVDAGADAQTETAASTEPSTDAVNKQATEPTDDVTLPDPSHFQVLGIPRPLGSKPMFNPKAVFGQPEKTSTAEPSEEGRAIAPVGSFSGAILPGGLIRDRIKEGALAPAPPARQEETLLTIENTEGSEPSSKRRTKKPVGEENQQAQEGFIAPVLKIGNVTAKSDGKVIPLRAAAAQSALAPAQPLVTIDPPGGKPRRTNSSANILSVDSATANASINQLNAARPVATTTARPGRQLECETNFAWRDDQSGLTVACGQSDEIWVPYRCLQGQLCLSARDSSFRLCCYARV